MGRKGEVFSCNVSKVGNNEVGTIVNRSVESKIGNRRHNLFHEIVDLSPTTLLIKFYVFLINQTETTKSEERLDFSNTCIVRRFESLTGPPSLE